MTSTTIFEVELFAANVLPQLPSEKLKKAEPDYQAQLFLQEAIKRILRNT